jgi:hypothetical protein
MLKYLEPISIFGSTASAIQVVGSLISIFLVGGGGIMSYLFAEDAPLLAPLGAVGWVASGVLVSLLVAIVLWIFALTNKANADARYLEMMALRDGQIDPSQKHFSNRTIPVHDLNLPSLSLHEDKLFEDCVFGGPGALMILGGKIDHNEFTELGTVIALAEDVSITGIPALKECTIKRSKFHRVTLLCDQKTGRALELEGAKVSGLQDNN